MKSPQLRQRGKIAYWALPAWALALVCVASGTAQAALVASLQVGTFNQPVQSYSSGTASPAALGAGGATATLQFTGSAGSSGLASLVDGPAVSASLAATSGQVNYADASIQYALTVTGPAGNTALVPLLVSGQYRTLNPDELPEGAGGTEAHSLLGITGPSGTLFEFRSDVFNYPPSFQELGPELNSGAGTYQGSFSVTAGSSLRIALRALVWRRFDDRAPSAASAEIDPYFQIDPAWAVTHPGYSLVFDAGVGNSAPLPLPEPSAALLTMSGLVALAVRRPRRRSL